MAISDEKMNGDILPGKSNLVLVLREKSNLLLMMLSDLLNISTALKFKCHLRVLVKPLCRDRKGCVWFGFDFGQD